MMRVIVSGKGAAYANYVTRLRAENIPFTVKRFTAPVHYQSSKNEIKLWRGLGDQYRVLSFSRWLLIRDHDFAVARLLATNLDFQIVENYNTSLRG